MLQLSKRLTLIHLGLSLNEVETQAALLMIQNNTEQICEEEQLKMGQEQPTRRRQ